MRMEVLREYQGRCYVCGIEEWRLGKRLHLRQLLETRSYAKTIVVLCSACRQDHEDSHPARVHRASWMRLSQTEEEISASGAGLMALMADDRKSVPYRPRLNKITGNALASIVLQQAIYWWFKSARRPFYKFSGPCAHERYRVGDSWQEELALTRYEMEGALKRLGRRIRRGESREEAMKESFIVWWVDGKKVPYYALNETLIESRLAEIYGAASTSESEDDENKETGLDTADSPPDGDPDGTPDGVPDVEKPHRGEDGGRVNGEFPHRGGGVNGEFPHSIYDGEKPHSINQLPETTQETTFTDTTPEQAPGGGAKEIKTLPRTKSGTIRGLTDDQAEILVEDALARDPLRDEVERLLAVAAAGNKNGELKMTRAWNAFVEPYGAGREKLGYSDDSWRYGFEQALERGAANINYVKTCAEGHHQRTARNAGGKPWTGKHAKGKEQEKSAASRGVAPEEVLRRAREDGSFDWLADHYRDKPGERREIVLSLARQADIETSEQNLRLVEDFLAQRARATVAS